ncbi:MAG: IS3 family transposase [Methylophaga sp.]|nr:IS3 family transposase [Methylophaga sp.]
MRVSTSAYYAWVNSPDRQGRQGRQDRAKEENELKEKIKQIFYENKQVYGTRRISDALSKLGSLGSVKPVSCCLFVVVYFRARVGCANFFDFKSVNYFAGNMKDA